MIIVNPNKQKVNQLFLKLFLKKRLTFRFNGGIKDYE